MPSSPQAFSLEELFAFVALAGRSTYASGAPPIKNAERKDFLEYEFAQGDWSYRDSYIGHTRSAGQELVRYKGEVVWAHSYGGGMTDGNEHLANDTFTFLKEALSQIKDSWSMRGPQEFTQDDWSYRYNQQGEIDEFIGHEQILYKGVVVFFHRTIGGMVVHK